MQWCTQGTIFIFVCSSRVNQLSTLRQQVSLSVVTWMAVLMQLW